jgi:tetratricopeptide (TPR) repeat protein
MTLTGLATTPSRERILPGYPGRRKKRGLCVASALMWSLALMAVHGQTSPRPPDQNPLQQHYNSAQNLQAAGDLERAAAEYKKFLAEALRHVARNRANVGGPEEAVPFLEEAVSLAPDDLDMRIEAAEACVAAGDLARAKSLAQEAVDRSPKSAKASLVLGQTLSQLGEHEAAKKQLELALALKPDFANGYALANEYLKLKQPSTASKLFAEMLAGFRDTAEIHFQFGTAYARSGYEQEAIAEFKKTIAKDNRFPGAHYSLGAAHLLGTGEIASQAEAVAEFREELKIQPNDRLSHWQLGHIALNEHRLEEAERELTRAAALDPQNPDIFLFLGQLYSETNRPSDAEAALRKSIAVAKDVSRSHYQAHYLLGRLLLQSGRTAEGQREMEISDQLLKQSVAVNQGKPAGLLNRDVVDASPLREAEKTELDPGALKDLESAEKQIRPAIADSYNNLGAIAAGRSEFPSALHYFEKAADWNPSLEGLDYNRGKAAFQAGQYQQAIAPLQRYLGTHPEDAWIRAALGTSFFMLKNYADTAHTLQPIEAQIHSVPRLALTYAETLVKIGDYTRGTEWLKNLEATNPNVADIHASLGEALAGQGQYGEAAEELRTALNLNPADANVKYHLALALLHLERKDESEALLIALVGQGSQDPNVYYQLGKLQLDRGEVKAAITSLEAGAKMSPRSDSMHYELAAAYRRDSRNEDAEREMKLYEALKSSGNIESPPKLN